MGDPEPIGDQVVEEMRHLPAIRAAEAMVTRGEVTVDEIVAQADKIKAVMSAVMKQGIHYGNIPGIAKPALLKPGAEVLNVTLRLAPDYESERIFQDDGHLTVVSKCVLRHIPTGLVVGSGEGLCTTRESKYAYRQGKYTCPACGAQAIVKSTRKKAYFCISAEGGCGQRYAFGSGQSKVLDQQDIGKVSNPDLPDQWNTVLKMADKRALVAAVLNATAASDVFTQDVEDLAPAQRVDHDDAADGSVPAEAGAGPGQPTQSRQQAAQNAGYPMPGSWPKVQEAIQAYGEQTWKDWLVFSGQAKDYLFGDEALDREKKADLRRVSAKAAKYLRDHVDVDVIPGVLRSDMREAWRVAMDVNELELAGPDWAMSPDEQKED